jgi:hypothetical protein
MPGAPKSRVKQAAANRGPIQRRSVAAWQDEVLIDALCADLAVGCSYETTGLAHGLGPSTLGGWVRDAVAACDALAADPDKDVGMDPAKLAAAVRLVRAHAGASQELERKLHAGEVWALEILSRRHRQTWGRSDTIAIGSADPGREVAVLLGALAAVAKPDA